MECKNSIHDLDGAFFSLFFIESNIITNRNNSDSTLTQIRYTFVPLILLHVLKQTTVFCFFAKKKKKKK